MVGVLKTDESYASSWLRGERRSGETDGTRRKRDENQSSEGR